MFNLYEMALTVVIRAQDSSHYRRDQHRSGLENNGCDLFDVLNAQVPSKSIE